MAEQVHDHVVVGGGIVGLSTALHLLRARPGADVLVLEKEQAVASHQTGHNSGVVHSGIYYTPGSLKARFCREGARLTAEYAVERGIPLHAIGKLLVATDERELAGLRTLRERADVNRVPAEMIDAAESGTASHTSAAWVRSGSPGRASPTSAPSPVRSPMTYGAGAAAW